MSWGMFYGVCFMANQLEPATLENIYVELGVARDEVKKIIGTRSSFEAMPLLQRLMRISQRAQDRKRSELTYLDRGSPHHRWSRPSQEGLEIGRILEDAVGFVHEDPHILNHLEELIDKNKPRKISTILRAALLKHEDSVTVYRVFGNEDIGGFEKGTFNKVMQYLLDRSGVRPSCRDELETQLLEEILIYTEGIPYGASSGLQLAKIALGDLLRGSTPKLNGRALGQNERLPHLDNVLVTQGVSEALNWLFGRSGYFRKGDMVIGTVPFYAAYNTLLEEEGIELIPLPTKSSGELDLEASNKLYADIS